MPARQTRTYFAVHTISQCNPELKAPEEPRKSRAFNHSSKAFRAAAYRDAACGNISEINTSASSGSLRTARSADGTRLAHRERCSVYKPGGALRQRISMAALVAGPTAKCFEASWDRYIIS